MDIFTIENPGVPFKPINTVFSHGVTGLSVVKDFWARISDVTGSRVKGYEKEAKNLIQGLVHDIAQEANDLGANAIIGLTISAFPVDAKGTSMLAVTVCGTAVKLLPKGTLSADEMNWMSWRNIP